MFCFRVESDVAQRLLAEGLGDHLVEGLQATIISRLREVYLGIVAEEVEHAGLLPDTGAFAASAGGPRHGALFANYRNDSDLDAGAERAYVRRGPGGVIERAAFQAWAWPEGSGAVRAVDVTIRLAVTGAGDGPDEHELRRRVDQAVSSYLRSAGAALVLPDMSSLLITVEHVGKDDEAHLRVAAAAAGDGVHGLSWAHDAEPRDLAEALAGQLGLRAAGPFGAGLALLGPRHIGLLRALAVYPKDVRDRLGWVRAGSQPAHDGWHLASAAVASPVAGYGAPPDLSELYEEPVAYARQPDGALTKAAVKSRLDWMEQSFEKEWNKVKDASVKLADGVTDEDVREILSRPDGERRWPELVSYLNRKDQSQPFDKNQPTEDWPSLKVANKWTVWHDIGLKADDWRFGAIRRAAKKIESAGYELEEVQFLLPKYDEPVTVKKGRAVRADPTRFGDAIYSPPKYVFVGPTETSDLSDRETQQGLYSHFDKRLDDRLAAIIVHEYGHHVHYMDHPDLLVDQMNIEFHPEFLDRVAAHVSQYATGNTAEAVAELFVKKVFGFALEDWEKQMLTALGAGRMASESPMEYRNPQPGEGLIDQVVEILAGRPGEVADRKRVTAVIRGLTAGERHMNPRLIADRVQRILEREGLPARPGSSAPVPAVLLGGEQGYLRETESLLARALDGVTDREDPGARLYAVAEAWYPRRWDEDDTAQGLNSPRARLASALGGDWRPVGASLGAVMNRTGQLGHGAGAFLLSPPSGRMDLAAPRNAGFAYALRNLGGSLFLADLQQAPSGRMRLVTDPAKMPVLPEGTRVIVTGSDGHALRDPFGNITPSRPGGDATAPDGGAAAAAEPGEGPAANAYPWLGGMNPLRGRGELSGTGRVLVARVADARLAGDSAGPGEERLDEVRLRADRTDPVRLLEELADGRPWIRLPSTTGPALLGIIMRDAPDGARALAVVWQDRARPARVLNVVKDRHQGLVILDAETGRLADRSAASGGLDLVPLTAGIAAPVAGTSSVFQGDHYTVQGEPAVRSWFTADEIGAERFGGGRDRLPGMSFRDTLPELSFPDLPAEMSLPDIPPGMSFAGQRDSRRLQKYLAGTARLRHFPGPGPGGADDAGGAEEIEDDAPTETVFVGVRATPEGPAAFILNLNEGGRLRVSGRTLARLMHSALGEGPATEADVASVTMIDWREGVPGRAAAEFADEIGHLLGQSVPVRSPSSANTWSGWRMNVKNGGRWQLSAPRVSESPEAVTGPRAGREWKALARQAAKLMQQPYEDFLLGITPGWVRGLALVNVPAPAAEWALGLAVATGEVPGPVSEAGAAASVLSDMFDRVWNTLDQVALNLQRDEIADALWKHIGDRGAGRWPAGLRAEATALRVLQEFLARQVVKTLRKDYPQQFARLDDRAVLPLVQQAVTGLEQPPSREVIENVTAAFIELYVTDSIDLSAPQAQTGAARFAITRDPATSRSSRLNEKKRELAPAGTGFASAKARAVAQGRAPAAASRAAAPVYNPVVVPDGSFEVTLTGSVGGVIALPAAGTLTMDRIEELAARMVATFRQPYEGKNPPKWSTVAVEVPKGVAPESVAGVTQAVWKAAGLLDHGIYVKLHGWASPLRICP